MKERWKQIRIWDTPFPYNVSNCGRIENRGTLNLVRPQKNSKGYLKVNLCGYQFLIHRLVLNAFVGPCPEGREVHHIDGNKKNNLKSNLEWISHRENILKSKTLQNVENLLTKSLETGERGSTT